MSRTRNSVADESTQATESSLNSTKPSDPVPGPPDSSASNPVSGSEIRPTVSSRFSSPDDLSPTSDTSRPSNLSVSLGRLGDFLDTMVERERIRERRAEGLPKPWTEDLTFQVNKFCNVFRDDDRQTRDFFSSVREQQLTAEDVVAHSIVFRMFNLVPTYLAIKHHITWDGFDAGAMKATLDGEGPWTGSVMFSDAYLIPGRFTGELTDKGQPKRHLIVDRFERIFIPANRDLLKECKTPEAFFELLRTWLYRGSKKKRPSSTTKSRLMSGS